MPTPTASPVLDVHRVRAEFPVLERETRPGVRLVYLDSAATSQKPRLVLDAMTGFYEQHNANIHRGIHRLAEEATEAYESARRRIAAFIGVHDPAEIVFTRNATESINLVASTWGRDQLQRGDLIVLTEMEHHANLVPWHMLAAERGVTLAFIPVTDDGRLDRAAYHGLLDRHPRLVAFTAMSNVLGTINPTAEMAAEAHAAGARVLVDAAQSVPHLPTDTAALGADFLVFSGHKMCGPTGIGVLHARRELLEAMPPYQGGGDMIHSVSFAKTTYAPIPGKFEAGTPDIAGVVGLGAAVDYLAALDWDAVAAHEADLLADAVEQICDVPGVTLIGTAAHKAAVVSFVMDGVHAHDIGTIVDQEGIAVRTGHHCTQPVMDFFGVPATTRASFALYNTREDIAALAAALHKVRKVFG